MLPSEYGPIYALFECIPLDRFGFLFCNQACESNFVKCVDFLAKRGANKETRDHAKGETPLHVVASRGHHESVEVLLKYGAQTNSRRISDSATAIWLACAGGHVGCVVALLAHESDPVDADAPTLNGVRPIEVASSSHHIAVVDLLVAHGVSSFVQPDLWLGPSFGKRMLRYQLPERLAEQRRQDAEEAAERARLKAEEEAEARRLEEEAKAKKNSKNKPEAKADKKGKKKK